MNDQNDAPKKILVIDDEPDVVEYLETLLQDNGYKTFSAMDGFSGFEIMQKTKPSLVILDLLMPKHTGTDFYRRMIKEQDLADTPVIVVSAVSGRNLALRKPAAVFDKPIDPGEFIKAVKQALGEQE